MATDDPPYLPVGTDVSAKYRGAFCEAKVKKLVKSVKCKVILKEAQTSLVLTDENIKGTLQVGATVEVKHPESGQIHEAVIAKLTDCSMYTVVFDDADERTLRRTQLCLKGEKHFIESETLDNLPLSNPEHFGTPVMQSKTPKKSRLSLSGNKSYTVSRDENDMGESSSDESLPKRPTYKGRLQELVGKVMFMDGDKRKSVQLPVLVVLPDASATELKTKDHMLVRSFKDGKFLAVLRKELKDFTQELAMKNEDKSLKSAIEKALLYFDSRELPSNWDKEELLGTDYEEVSENEDSSDDEPSEEKDRFVAQLYKFMDDRGTPINKGPCIGSRDLNLYRLFRVVQNIGGYNKVTNTMRWRLVYSKMGLPPSNTASHQIKSAYKKFLHAFEDFYRKLGSSMGTISRPGRSRHNSGRSVLAFRDRDKDQDKKGSSQEVKESVSPIKDGGEGYTKVKDVSDEESEEEEPEVIVPPKTRGNKARTEETKDKDAKSVKDEVKDKKDDAKDKKIDKKEETKDKKTDKKEEIKDKKTDKKEEIKDKKTDKKEEIKDKKTDKKEEIKDRKEDNKEKKIESGKKGNCKETGTVKKSDKKEDVKDKKSESKDQIQGKKADAEKTVKDKSSDKSKDKKVEKKDTEKAKKVDKKDEIKEKKIDTSEDTKEKKGVKKDDDGPKKVVKKEKAEDKKEEIEKKEKIQKKETESTKKPVEVKKEIEKDVDKRDAETPQKKMTPGRRRSLRSEENKKEEEDSEEEEKEVKTKNEVDEKKTRSSKEDNKDEVKKIKVEKEDKKGKTDTEEQPETKVGKKGKDDKKTETNVKVEPEKKGKGNGEKKGKADTEKKVEDEKTVNQEAEKDPAEDYEEEEDFGGEEESKVDSSEEHAMGTKMQVRYGRGRNQKIYEAKVVESSKDGGKLIYLVHYAGWNNRYDEWVKPDRIVSIVERPDVPKTKKQESPKSPKSASKIKRGRPFAAALIPTSHTRSSSASTDAGPVKMRSPAPTPNREKPRPTRSNSMEFPFLGGLPAKSRMTRRNSGVTDASDRTSHVSESEESTEEEFEDNDHDDAETLDTSKEEMEPDITKEESVDSIMRGEPHEEPPTLSKIDESRPIPDEKKETEKSPVESLLASTTVEKEEERFSPDLKDKKEDNLKVEEIDLDFDVMNVVKEIKDRMDEQDSKKKKDVEEKIKKIEPEMKPVEKPKKKEDKKVRKEEFKWEMQDEVSVSLKQKDRAKEKSILTREPEKEKPLLTKVAEKVYEFEDEAFENIVITHPKPVPREDRKLEVEKQLENLKLRDEKQYDESTSAPLLCSRFEVQAEEKLKSEVESDKKGKVKKAKEPKKPKLSIEKKSTPPQTGDGYDADKKEEPPTKNFKEDTLEISEDQKIPAIVESSEPSGPKDQSEPVKESNENEKKRVKKKVKKKAVDSTDTLEDDSKKDTAKKNGAKSKTKNEKSSAKQKDKKIKETVETKENVDMSDSVGSALVKVMDQCAVNIVNMEKSRSASPDVFANKRTVSELESGTQDTVPSSSALSSVRNEPQPSGSVTEHRLSQEPSEPVSNIVFDNTPPTTPEHEMGASTSLPEQQSGLVYMSGQGRTELKGDSNVLLCTSVPSGGESPTGDVSPRSYEGSIGSGNVACSDSSNEASHTVGKRRRESEEHTPSKKRKRTGRGRPTKDKSSPKHNGSDSEEATYIDKGSSPEPSTSSSVSSGSCSPGKTMTVSNARPRSPRPSKYNFNLDQGKYLEGDQRISFLVGKIQEIRKIYMGLKTEVACIDRRRKRARRRDKEGGTASCSSTVEVECS